MLPKWYNEWNAKNPVDYIKPIVGFGILGGVVFCVIALLSLGQPFATSSLQTGPRGNGMSVTKFNAALAITIVLLPDLGACAAGGPWRAKVLRGSRFRCAPFVVGSTQL